VQRAPGIPHALVFFRAKPSCIARAKSRRGVAEVCIDALSLSASSLRTQGPILCGEIDGKRCMLLFFQQCRPVVMGPCFRRDDQQRRPGTTGESALANRVAV
jgi:hypothetical protein